MINLLKLLPWIAFIIGDALYDFWEIKKGQRPWYFNEWFIRAMAALAHAFLWLPNNTIEWLPIVIWQVSIFWIVFDLFLNGLRRKPALYVGLNSGWFDPYFAEHPINHVIAKVMALALMVLSTIVIYHK